MDPEPYSHFNCAVGVLGLSGFFPVLRTFEPFDTNLILQRRGKVSPGSQLFQIIFSTRRAVGLE